VCGEKRKLNVKKREKNRKMRKVTLISIDGNIGSGKSYLLQKLRQDFPTACFIDEPLDTWTSLINKDGESLLSVFYKDKKRWGYTFQNCALLTRFQNIEECIRRNPDKEIFITERSIETDFETFTRMLHDTEEIDELEFSLYLRWYEFVKKTCTPISAMIFVDTDVDLCVERLHKRARKGEESVSKEYLSLLDTYNRKWVDSIKKQTDILLTDSDDVETVISFIKNVNNRSFSHSLFPISEKEEKEEN
jgi:deoxyguanosine kinase